jgi:putative DNA primase/helicase
MSLRPTPEHLADLRASGLTDDTIAESGAYSESDGDRVNELLGGYVSRKTARSLGPCLAFPFSDADGQPVTFTDGKGQARPFVRLKPAKPRKNPDGKPQKYESPLKSGNHAYVPPGARSAIKDPTAMLLVTEGEKKALAGTQHGFPTLGLCEVWNWALKRPKNPANGRGTGPRRLIADLERINWQGRKVVIVFDSDAVTKPEVRWARWHLARALAKRGADVRVVDLPGDPDGKKAVSTTTSWPTVPTSCGN